MTSDKLVMTNGRILLKRENESSPICRVVKVAKNVNYEGLGKEIKPNDLVVINEYYYHSVHLEDGKFHVVKPNAIVGYIE